MFGAVPASLILKVASLNGKYVQLPLPLNLPPEYTLPNEYFSSVQTGFEYIPTASNGKFSSIQCVDHPGFTRLRDMLDKSGYIKAQRNWSNGDIVLKRFRLNGKWFEPDSRFPCAPAMNIVFRVRDKQLANKEDND